MDANTPLPLNIAITETIRKYAWHARTVFATRRRSVLMATPVALNIILILAIAASVYPVVFRLWPDAWEGSVIGTVFIAIIAGIFTLGVLLLGLYLFTVTTVIIGGPFYGMLVEERLRGKGAVVVHERWGKTVARQAGDTVRYLILLGVVWAFAWAFNLLPVIGSFAFLFLSFAASLFFLSFEYFNEGFVQLGVPFGKRVRRLLRDWPLAVGFGAVTFFLLLMPVLNLFVPALAMLVAADWLYERGV